MSLPAFYLPAREWTSCPVLEGAETAHMHVLRIGEGDEIMLLDGEGRSAICRVLALSRKSARLELLAEKRSGPPEAKALLALALSKAVRRDFFMEKAAELGAWEIWLWQARHSQGRLEDSTVRSVEARLVAGLKQCRGAWLPRVRVFQSLSPLLVAAASADWRVLPWEMQSGVPMVTPDQLGRAGETVYVIGPEGGFADSELELLRAGGFCAVSFGDRILRCETAATLCLGLHWWASQLPGHPDFRADKMQ